jgi:hypothetical protein
MNLIIQLILNLHQLIRDINTSTASYYTNWQIKGYGKYKFMETL